jgi:hypothetical protein
VGQDACRKLAERLEDGLNSRDSWTNAAHISPIVGSSSTPAEGSSAALGGHTLGGVAGGAGGRAKPLWMGGLELLSQASAAAEAASAEACSAELSTEAYEASGSAEAAEAAAPAPVGAVARLPPTALHRGSSVASSASSVALRV